MALDESIDGLEKMESNGVEAYIDPGLKEFLQQFEGISVDYVQRGNMAGFAVSVGQGGGDCASKGCGPGGCG